MKDQKLRILVADEDAVSLVIISKLASLGNHDVDAYKSSELALRVLCGGRTYDVLFIDIYKQYAAGLSIIRFVREIEKDSRSDPAIIIATTSVPAGFYDDEELRSYDALIVEKPYHIDRIINLLQGAAHLKRGFPKAIH